jgi:PBSX family phage terminase large subunit
VATSKVVLSKPQMQFVEASDRYTLFCGGLGSGKTYAGSVWAAMMALKHQNTSGIITANSYGQLTKATLVTFFGILDDLGIPYTYRRNAGEIDIYNTRIYTMSMENYNLLRGIEAGWAWSDECAFYSKESFDVLMGRIRDKNGPCQWKGSTTPNGFNWLYTSFLETPLPNSKVITSKTVDNLANLSESYVDTLLSQYDSNLMRQELEGEFINLTSGKVYYSFSRGKNVRHVEERNALIHLGLDFNVDPLCGTFCFQKDGKIHVSQELYQRDSNTFKAAKEIIQRYPQMPVQIVCDQTGDRRKTSSHMTDHEILRRSNLDVLKFTNPPEKDRQNNLNRLLEHELVIIDPQCKNLIADLEKLTHDNKDEMLGHISTALGYACWYFNPMKKPRRPATVRNY